MSAEKAVEHARSMLGVRWRHLGRKPWAVDCLGLVILSLRAAGCAHADAPDRYGREPWDDQLRKGLRERPGPPVDDWRPGDVALFRMVRDQPSHVGLLAPYIWGGLSLIHASNRHGVVEVALSGDLRERVIEVYRPRYPTDE